MSNSFAASLFNNISKSNHKPFAEDAWTYAKYYIKMYASACIKQTLNQRPQTYVKAAK